MPTMDDIPDSQSRLESYRDEEERREERFIEEFGEIPCKEDDRLFCNRCNPFCRKGD